MSEQPGRSEGATGSADPELAAEADRLNDAVSERPPVETQVAEQESENRPDPA